MANNSEQLPHPSTSIMLSIRVGRASRRENTSWVDPQAAKGLLSIGLGAEDGLLHLTWKNRETGNVEDV